MRAFPVLLIAVGAVLLMRNLGWISWDLLRIWWPAILIVAGVAGLVRAPGRSDDQVRNARPGEKAMNEAGNARLRD